MASVSIQGLSLSSSAQTVCSDLGSVLTDFICVSLSPRSETPRQAYKQDESNEVKDKLSQLVERGSDQDDQDSS